MRVALVLAAALLVGCGSSEQATMPEVTPIATETGDVHDPVVDCTSEITYWMDEVFFAESPAEAQMVYQDVMLQWGHEDPKYQALIDLATQYKARAYQVGIDQAIDETYPMVVARCEEIVN